MTTELRDDLINFSFHDLQDVFKNYQTHNPNSHYTISRFVPTFLVCLKRLVCHYFYSCILRILVFTHFTIQSLSEADHICQTLQVHFDGMLCNVLEKRHSFPGVTLLLGSIYQYFRTKQSYYFGAGMAVSSYLIWQQGEGHILDDTGLFGPNGIISHNQTFYLPFRPSILLVFHYLAEFLHNPKRSGTHIVDQQRYAAAAKECLQLFLFSHRNWSKGATEFACRDRAIRRSKPWEWVARLGVHSRIRKGRHHLKVRQHKSIRLKARYIVYQDLFLPKNSPKHQYCRSLSYRWALDLLPFFLERSAISLELANVLRRCTFTTMAWKFPRRRRLAKEAITKYLSLVEYAVGDQ